MVNEQEINVITAEMIHTADINLPVTKVLAEQYSGALKNYIVLHINHTLADVYAFNDYLHQQLGAELYFIGIPYSNKRAENRAYKNIYSIRDDSLHFLPYEDGKVLASIKPELDYIDLLKSQILYVLATYIMEELKKGKKLIILQDGGYTSFLKENGVSFLNVIPNLAGVVEQTSSGTRLLSQAYKNSSNNYPTVSIAKSEIKSSVEAQFICDSIFNAVQSIFKKTGQFLNYKSVCIGGYGVIGRSLATLMRGVGINVKVKETDKLIRSLAVREGFQTEEDMSQEDFEDTVLYLGCTGVSSFSIENLRMFFESNSTEYYLASGSSKRIEFWPIIEAFEQLWSDSSDKLISAHPFLQDIVSFEIKTLPIIGLLYKFELKNGVTKSLYMLGEGFPINFADPSNDGIPNRAIDLTQASLLSSCAILAQQHEVLENKLYLFRHKHTIGTQEIDENDILIKWLKENNIDLHYSYPLEHFHLHPLRGYLLDRTWGSDKDKK